MVDPTGLTFCFLEPAAKMHVCIVAKSPSAVSQLLNFSYETMWVGYSNLGVLAAYKQSYDISWPCISSRLL